MENFVVRVNLLSTLGYRILEEYKLSNQTTSLGTEKISRLMFRLAAPAIFAQVVNALYNIVDRIYIGNMADVGHLALTGVGLTAPIITLISACAALIGLGSGPFLGMALGEKDEKKAGKIIGFSFLAIIVFSVVLTGVIFVIKEPFLRLFGSSEEIFNYANEYITVYIIGTIFVSITLGLNPSINAQGFSKVAMSTTIIGAVCNIILDPIFIFVFDLGVQGAAIATVISQFISAVWIFRFLTSKKATITIKRKYVRFDSELCARIFSLGVSPFIMQATNSLMIIAINYQLSVYGNDYYIGAMSIITSITSFVFLPTQGLGTGAQAIISYNYGAQNYERVRNTFKILLKSCLIFTTFVWALVELFPEMFVVIFNNDPTLVEISSYGLRIQMATVFAMGAQTACQQAFVALGQAKVSAFIALLRKVFLLIPLTFVLPLFMGVDGVFYAEPVADILSATTCSIIFANYYKNNLSEKNFPKSEEVVNELK